MITQLFFRNRDYFYSETARMGPYPCESVIEADTPKGYFPHYLPGENPYLTEYAERHGLPYEATFGGAASMYPEYVETIREMRE